MRFVLLGGILLCAAGCGTGIESPDASADGGDASANACAASGGTCQTLQDLQCSSGGAPLSGYGCPSGEGCCIPTGYCDGRACSSGTICTHDVVDAGASYQCAAGDGAVPSCGVISCGVGCTCASVGACSCQ